MLTLKEFLDKSMNDSVNRLFAFLLDETCRDIRDVIGYLTKGTGTIINENIGIEFPETNGFFKDEEGYIEKGMELYLVYSKKGEKLSEIQSFFVDNEATYRYLRLFYNSYLELFPDDKKGLAELDAAYKFYREKYEIKEENPEFDYYNVLDNI